jgi:hypothetical protein
MSEDQQLQLTQLIDPAEENKKIAAWGKFGAQMYRLELALQLQSQEIVKQLIAPTDASLIIQAEQAVATVKKEYAALQKSRILVTSKFDPVVARLMQPEKSILDAIKANEVLILVAKLKEKEAAKTNEAKQKELKEVERIVSVYVADMHASYLAAQLKTLSDAYEYALTNNISMEALPEFKAKVCARVNLANRATPPPKPIAQYNTQEVIDAEVKKYFNPWPPIDYVNGFAADVEAKFSDWEQAIKDKEAAKELNQKEVTVTTDAINTQLEKQKISAGLNALAVPVAERVGGKQLKESWTMVEPESVDDVFAVINAFAVNRDLVKGAVEKIKPINFSVKQMIAALVKVKSEDENFECTGITFTKIDKL